MPMGVGRKGSLSVEGITFGCEELLGRPEWRIATPDAESVARLGTCIVTGGGGSIGSVLVRALTAAGAPVVVADVDEDRLYRTSVVLGDAAKYQLLDIGDRRQVDAIVQRVRPQTIFHLAAKKHVRFVQGAARAAFTANAMGTMHVLEASQRAGQDVVVVVTSSDKAAVPHNLVGLTKRTAEDIVGAYASLSGAPVRAVRLPNVLGTAGGVLEHYVNESSAGRALDVWSRDMSRYFCCVHEAAHALIDAALSDATSPLMLFDVGSPIGIVDLAERVATTLTRHVGDVEVVVSERFESVHPRHEALFGPDEHRDDGGSTPRLAAVDRLFRPYPDVRDAIVRLAESDETDAELEVSLRMMHAGALPGGL